MVWNTESSDDGIESGHLYRRCAGISHVHKLHHGQQKVRSRQRRAIGDVVGYQAGDSVVLLSHSGLLENPHTFRAGPRRANIHYGTRGVFVVLSWESSAIDLVSADLVVRITVIDLYQVPEKVHQCPSPILRHGWRAAPF